MSADFDITHLFLSHLNGVSRVAWLSPSIRVLELLNQCLPGLLVNLNCFQGLILHKNFQNQTSSFPVIDCDPVCKNGEIGRFNRSLLKD